MKMSKDMNRNSINLFDDVFVLEKEYCAKERLPAKFQDDIESDDRHRYDSSYVAIFKSVNYKNIILYRFHFTDEIHDIDIRNIRDCIDEIGWPIADFFYQPDCTLVVEHFEDLNLVEYGTIYHKRINVKSLWKDIEDLFKIKNQKTYVEFVDYGN